MRSGHCCSRHKADLSARNSPSGPHVVRVVPDELFDRVMATVTDTLIEPRQESDITSRARPHTYELACGEGVTRQLQARLIRRIRVWQR